MIWKRICFFVKLTRSSGIKPKSTRKFYALIIPFANDLRFTAVLLYGISIKLLTFRPIMSDFSADELISINFSGDTFRISLNSSWNISIMKSSKHLGFYDLHEHPPVSPILSWKKNALIILLCAVSIFSRSFLLHFRRQTNHNRLSFLKRVMEHQKTSSRIKKMNFFKRGCKTYINSSLHNWWVHGSSTFCLDELPNYLASVLWSNSADPIFNFSSLTRPKHIVSTLSGFWSFFSTKTNHK